MPHLPGTDFPRQMIGPIGRQHLDREGMYARFELVVEGGHDRTVLRHARLTGKLAGRDSDAEMRLAAFLPSGMSTMALALVDHLKVERSELGGELFGDRVADGHFWVFGRC
jgi:hypothetical protein